MPHIRPFCGTRYHENALRSPDGTMPCVICGRPIAMDLDPPMAEVVDGGRFAMESGPEPDVNDPGYMGWWPVGPECIRHLRGVGVKIAAGARK